MGKTYFASDFHLGTPNHQDSLQREKKIVSWLEDISSDAERLFLLGDIFDFWYEYKTVVPKYYTRLLGKLAEMSDRGIEIYFFKGNHDMWTFGYLEEEVGVKVIDDELEIELHGKTCFIHHGDALGPGDPWYKFVRKVFRNKLSIWLFHRLHPNFGIGLAQFLSKSSRKKNAPKDQKSIPLEDEFQYQFIQNHEADPLPDFYIFGHRHQPRDSKVRGESRLINLGDWVQHYTYAVLDENEMALKTYRS